MNTIFKRGNTWYVTDTENYNARIMNERRVHRTDMNPEEIIEMYINYGWAESEMEFEIVY